jgi:hypothetical protein
MTDYPKSIALLHELAADGNPDELDGTDRVHLFTSGGCALYATGLVAQHPDRTVIAYGYTECTEDRDDNCVPCGDYGHNVCGCKVHHFYTLSSDGTLYDVQGAHSVTTISDRAYDNDCALWAIDDTVLSNVIESWHFSGDDDAHIAALAVALTCG